ncbi:MAG: UDP-2,3-diacylglucosamine diphosphatase [Bacteroidetes bacterium]|nr:UDP-2,3-diacylglucosamine diphosphatase [Bacteroidota bacterium]MDA0873520.1 UDP-2,3-diacylglucosamine diphosphatase [Bacteroidota bacterium]
MSHANEPTSHRFRTIWISDFHLGTKHTRVADLLDFLRHMDSAHLFLVGDIFDGWALSRTWYWKQSHNDVVQKLLRKGRKGTRIVYIPGNHDEFARDYVGHRFGDILVERETTHELLDGTKVLVLHGDEFDGIIRYARWLQILGAIAYGFALGLNSLFNRVRLALGRPYWSLSAYLKQRTKKALQYVDDFEQLVAEKAREEGVDGVVCGHIHQAEMRTIEGIRYMNTGDWVESCTALVEHLDGRLELLDWTDAATRERFSLEHAVAPDQQELFSRGDGLPGRVPVMTPTTNLTEAN